VRKRKKRWKQKKSKRRGKWKKEEMRKWKKGEIVRKENKGRQRALRNPVDIKKKQKVSHGGRTFIKVNNMNSILRKTHS